MMDWSANGLSGVTVTVRDQAALLQDLEARIEAGQGYSIATINLDHAVKLKTDAAFLEAYLAHSHVTADGKPIVWLSRLAGQDVSLIPGSELIEPLIALAARTQTPVAFFGATDAALEAAATRLKAQYEGLNIVLTLSPAMGFDPGGTAAQSDIEAIKASGARLCFLALGAPKQELFAARAQQALPQVGFVSIGAGLDFIAGTQRRAPVWVRKLAAEWLWRMLSNPRRLAARYGACILALPRLTLRALQSRKRQSGVAS